MNNEIKCKQIITVKHVLLIRMCTIGRFTKEQIWVDRMFSRETFDQFGIHSFVFKYLNEFQICITC